jgi:hypothetical protein
VSALPSIFCVCPGISLALSVSSCCAVSVTCTNALRYRYYTGEVIEHSDNPDPWDSVHVKWDAEEGEEGEVNWVCPWELQVCHGASSAKQKPGLNGMVVRNAAEASRMPRGGVYTTGDDESPLSIAQKRDLDVELIVMLNKEELKGLTRYSKLLNGTKVKLPPLGYRYQRSGGTVVNTSVDGTAELEFPKEDEVFWEGVWTEGKRKVADDVLRKITRQRGIGPFLTPVDHTALGLNDYLSVIETPMDLGTVESRFKGTDGEKEYVLPKDYYREMKLVFENAKRYNPQGSELYRKAVNFLNSFEDWWRDQKKQLEQAERDEQMRKRKAFDKEAARKRASLGSLGLMQPGTPLAYLQGIQLPPHLAHLLTPGVQASFAAAMEGKAMEGMGSDKRTTVSCGICGGEGHNRRTCPQVQSGAASNSGFGGTPAGL